MTLHELSIQLYGLSVDGYFNGEKYSRERLEKQIGSLVRNIEKTAIPNHLVMAIALPDGWWAFQIERRPDGEYGYWIPETRTEEARLIERLTGGTGGERAKAPEFENAIP